MNEGSIEAGAGKGWATGEIDTGFANNGSDYITSPTFYGQTQPLARRGRLVITTGDGMGNDPYTVVRVWQ